MKGNDGRNERSAQKTTNFALEALKNTSPLPPPYLMEYHIKDCKQCNGHDYHCDLYEPIDKDDRICMYHAYRISEHGSLFQWKKDISELEKLVNESWSD